MAEKRTTRLDCAMAQALHVIGDYWTMLILRDLMMFGGTRRFESLRDGLQISRNILTERLRLLVEKEIIRKVPIAEGARRMQYKLTRKGWELAPICLAMSYWCIRWGEDEVPERYAFVDKATGKPGIVPGIVNEEGKPLGPGDLAVHTLTQDAKDYMEQFATPENAD
ncbi:MAG: helix-turn-helix transcriptional regulator [Porticoccaceae bacterium]|nr:helix-turn-helix transcriptional regulator [Porticoccaceae bacterium]